MECKHLENIYKKGININSFNARSAKCSEELVKYKSTHNAMNRTTESVHEEIARKR